MPDEVLTFVPNIKYITKNLKPEYIKKDTIRNLAWALKDANDQGVLDKRVDQWILPQTLVEGRDDYGTSRPGLPTESKLQSAIDKELIKRYAQQEEAIKYYRRSGGEVGDVSSSDPFFNQYRGIWAENRGMAGIDNANYAIGILQQLMKQYKDVPLALTRWNGKGVSIENGADANNHLRKVQEMQRMLSHPANRELMDYFRQFRNSKEYP